MPKDIHKVFPQAEPDDAPTAEEGVTRADCTNAQQQIDESNNEITDKYCHRFGLGGAREVTVLVEPNADMHMDEGLYK